MSFGEPLRAHLLLIDEGSLLGPLPGVTALAEIPLDASGLAVSGPMFYVLPDAGGETLVGLEVEAGTTAPKVTLRGGYSGLVLLLDVQAFGPLLLVASEQSGGRILRLQ